MSVRTNVGAAAINGPDRRLDKLSSPTVPVQDGRIRVSAVNVALACQVLFWHLLLSEYYRGAPALEKGRPCPFNLL